MPRQCRLRGVRVRGECGAGPGGGRQGGRIRRSGESEGGREGGRVEGWREWLILWKDVCCSSTDDPADEAALRDWLTGATTGN